MPGRRHYGRELNCQNVIKVTETSEAIYFHPIRANRLKSWM